MQRSATRRLMTEQDLGEVLRIERLNYQFPWSDAIFRDCLKVGYHCEVVCDGDAILGYGILMLAGQEAHVLNISIQPESRGNGLARDLLHSLLDTVRRKGGCEVFLEVRPSNKVAVGLYESLGFNEVGRRPDYYDAAGGREDALIFALNLGI